MKSLATVLLALCVIITSSGYADAAGRDKRKRQSKYENQETVFLKSIDYYPASKAEEKTPLYDLMFWGGCNEGSSLQALAFRYADEAKSVWDYIPFVAQKRVYVLTAKIGRDGKPDIEAVLIDFKIDQDGVKDETQCNAELAKSLATAETISVQLKFYVAEDIEISRRALAIFKAASTWSGFITDVTFPGTHLIRQGRAWVENKEANKAASDEFAKSFHHVRSSSKKWALTSKLKGVRDARKTGGFNITKAYKPSAVVRTDSDGKRIHTEDHFELFQRATGVDFHAVATAVDPNYREGLEGKDKKKVGVLCERLKSAFKFVSTIDTDIAMYRVLDLADPDDAVYHCLEADQVRRLIAIGFTKQPYDNGYSANLKVGSGT